MCTNDKKIEYVRKIMCNNYIWNIRLQKVKRDKAAKIAKVYNKMSWGGKKKYGDNLIFRYVYIW